MGGYSEQCRMCDKWFLERSAFKQHLRDKHNLSLQEYERMPKQAETELANPNQRDRAKD